MFLNNMKNRYATIEPQCFFIIYGYQELPVVLQHVNVNHAMFHLQLSNNLFGRNNIQQLYIGSGINLFRSCMQWTCLLPPSVWQIWEEVHLYPKAVCQILWENSMKLGCFQRTLGASAAIQWRGHENASWSKPTRGLDPWWKLWPARMRMVKWSMKFLS